MAHVLVTGGAGYIGSHAVVELLGVGHAVTVIDDLSNSFIEVVDRVRAIARESGRELALEPDLEFVQVDICDQRALNRAFSERPVDSVMHFAGWKAVGESVEKPLEYYRNNVGGTLTLLEVMRAHETRSLVFSSSCTVYGEPDSVPIDETAPLRPAASPYGNTKRVIEDILRDVVAADPEWRVALLRYFNPVGAHLSGRIGEDPRGVPNNLMPFIMQVAAGKHERLRVFGGDYPTRDGTCIRDYIHVVDLVLGHLRALEYLESRPGCHAFNLGTGTGTTVLEMVRGVEEAIGQKIPREVVGRRPGDVVAIWADPTRAEAELGWRAERDLNAMCCDHWRWQVDNPDGYRS